jgi:hypothetical protein
MQNVLNDIDGAIEFVHKAEKQHPNRIDICQNSTNAMGAMTTLSSNPFAVNNAMFHQLLFLLLLEHKRLLEQLRNQLLLTHLPRLLSQQTPLVNLHNLPNLSQTRLLRLRQIQVLLVKRQVRLQISLYPILSTR